MSSRTPPRQGHHSLLRQRSPKTLSDIITLFTNLITQAIFFIKDTHNAKNRPLIVDFLYQKEDVLISAKFITWHEKHERLCPWLPHFYVTFIHSVCCALADLAIDYTQKYIISRGQSLPATAYDSVINIMGDVHMILKSGVCTNSISVFDRPTPSYQFFKESIETDQHTKTPPP